MPFPAVNAALERALVARAYDEPTAVQLAVLAPAAAGCDMLVSAQTGSGKTVAFGLALAHRLLGEAERFEAAAEPLALIIAPTRELAVQVQRELAWLYAEAGASIASCIGGMDPRAERIALGQGAHIVVGTPGRLRDHLERGRLDMSKLRCVVLDEADEMLDLGFRDDLQFILDATPAERQTLMFSATVPRDIENLARSYQRDAVRIETTLRHRQHDDIEYRAVRTVPYAIEPTIVNLLRFFDSTTTLVFCATREGVRRLHSGLVGRGFSAVALSGELSQAERTEALQAVRDGRAKVLVATDVAARGLDLADLSLVIHSDLPNDHETLLHRSGRTGRAGRKGISVLVVAPNKRRRAEELLGRGRITAAWSNVPTAKEIAAKDHERLMALPILDELATAEDLALGRELLEGRTPEQLAAALIRVHRAGLPTPENLKDPGRPAELDRNAGAGATDRPWRERPGRSEPSGHDMPHPGRGNYGPRPPRAERMAMQSDRQGYVAHPTPHVAERPVGGRREPVAPHAAGGGYQAHAPREQRNGYQADTAQRSPDSPSSRRASGQEARDQARPAASGGDHGGGDRGGMVWFGLNIGREKNADPRWLLPLICRVGEVSKNEVGSIKVGDSESTFQICEEHADRFAEAVKISKHKEGRIWRIDAAPATRAATVESAPSPRAAPASRLAGTVRRAGTPVAGVPAAAAPDAGAPDAKRTGYAKRPAYAARPERRPFRDARPDARPDAKPRYERSERAPDAGGTGYAKRPADAARPERRPFRDAKPDAKPRYERSERAPVAGPAKKPFDASKRFKPDGRKPRPGAGPHNGKSSAGRPFKPSFKSKSKRQP